MSKHAYLLLIVILLSTLMACSPQDETPAQNPIVYGLTLQPSGIDPHIHASSELGIVLRQVYDTLVYRHPETKDIVPGLAERWEISPDNLTYTFYLKQGAIFHDGTPFNAQAVAANLDRITAPETGSQRARFMLGSYVSYTLVDAYTIQLHLSEPFAPLLDSLSQVYLGIASPTALSAYDTNRYQFHQVGTGPFRFVEYTPGESIILERNPAYAWEPDFYSIAPENAIDRITYRFFTDPPTRSIALESGEAQIMGEIPPSFAATLNATGDAQLLPTAIPGLPLQFIMNTTQAPTDDLRVRQALIQATNRPIIVDTIFRGFSPIAWGPLSRETLYYSPAVEGMYPYNVNAARSLLESAGYSDSDSDGILDKDGEPLEVTLIVPPWGLLPDVAQVIQSQWREVGILANLRQVAGFSALLESVEEGDYHLVAFDSAGYDPYVLNAFYLSDGSNNFSHISNAELDVALLTATRNLNPSQRAAQYAEIQQYIMNQALILPIRDYVNLNATDPGVDGLAYDVYGWFPLLANVRYQRK